MKKLCMNKLCMRKFSMSKKNIYQFCVVLMLLLSLSGCKKTDKQLTVTNPKNENTLVNVNESKTTEKASVPAKVDIDLSKMGTDMVYAFLFQMIIDPDTYIGKTIRIKGLYYYSVYEPTQQCYHSVIIRDATGCCAQGLDFELIDADAKYPEPESDIEVVGEYAVSVVDGVSHFALRDAIIE